MMIPNFSAEVMKKIADESNEIKKNKIVEQQMQDIQQRIQEKASQGLYEMEYRFDDTTYIIAIKSTLQSMGFTIKQNTIKEDGYTQYDSISVTLLNIKWL